MASGQEETREVGGVEGLIAAVIIRAKEDSRNPDYEDREAAQQWLYNHAPALLQDFFNVDEDAARLMLLDILTAPDETREERKERTTAIRKERRRNEREARATYDPASFMGAKPKQKRATVAA